MAAKVALRSADGGPPISTLVQLQQGGHFRVSGVLVVTVKNVINKRNGSEGLLDGLGRRNLRAKVVENNLGQFGASDLVRPIRDLVKRRFGNEGLGRVTLHSDFNFEQGRSRNGGVSRVFPVDAALHLSMESCGDLRRDVGF